MIATNIIWDIDEEDGDIELPTTIEIPYGMTDEEEISDYITNVTGFCHKGFSIEGEHVRFWKKIIGNRYDERAEQYIKTLDFSGGGAYSIDTNGRYRIEYASKEKKVSIKIANIKLFLMWITRKRGKNDC